MKPIEELRAAASEWLAVAELSPRHLRFVADYRGTLVGGVRLTSAPALELLVADADGGKPPIPLRRWDALSVADFTLIGFASSVAVDALRRLDGEARQGVAAALSNGAYLAVFFRFVEESFEASVSLWGPSGAGRIELACVQHAPEVVLH